MKRRLLPRLGAKEHRLRKQKTGGEVGYLHIPDMGQPGLNQFTKFYFPQIRKHALIVDVRRQRRPDSSRRW